jgi:hypothetical protein
MFALAYTRPLPYSMLLQEDRFVEWLTVGLFLAAGIIRLRNGFAQRHWFDILIALFCIFVAGEEFSWGQRLVGFTPPEVFLEHNTQQEFTLHNFSEFFGKPKGVLMLALTGYAVVLPALARVGRLRALIVKAGATTPPWPTIPWFVIAVILLAWYPLEFTGEWVEALAGFLFLVSAAPSRTALAISLPAAAVGAALLSAYSARGFAAHPQLLRCARLETEALMRDVNAGPAATEELLDPDRSIHKRFFTAIADGYINPGFLPLYQRIQCGKSQQYFLDSWGMPYWIRVDADGDGGRRLQIYSMGPNRRRDSSDENVAGDDIAAETRMRY